MWVWLSFDSCTSILFRIQTIPDRLIENQIEDCRAQHFLAARKQPGVFDCLVYNKKKAKKVEPKFGHQINSYDDFSHILVSCSRSHLSSLLTQGNLTTDPYLEHAYRNVYVTHRM